MSDSPTPTPAIRDVLAEREKQRAKWGDAHDDDHDEGDIARAASLLCHPDTMQIEAPEWAHVLVDRNSDEPRRLLVIAAALLLAEIERLDRCAK